MTIMMLSEWIKQNKGCIARIGTNAGSGYVFAGVVDSFTLNHIEACTHVKMHAREVVEVYPSVYDGVIVIVTGQEYGKMDRSECGEKPGAEIPIELYQSLIGEVARIAAEEYETALLKFKYAVKDRDVDRAAGEMYLAQQFFLSDTFALLMPHVNGEEVLHLIEQKVDKKNE